DKALQLDSSNSTAQIKLSMIRDLIGTASRPGSGRPATPPAIGPIAAAPVVAPPAPVAAPKPVEAPKPVPAPVTPPPAAKPAPTPVPVAAPTPAAPAVAAAKPATKPAPEASNNDDVARAINAWAAAWSKKDVKGYLSHYARDFKTPGGMARNAWETERNQRIKKPGNIQVGVDSLKVSIEGGDHATVRFRQHYKSASLTTSSGKTLVLVKRDGKWLIQQERIGG
ncbi:MAG TPA: nuclear transport factor 2 family protein, partial [Rhodocyclaceae bacterium]